LLQPWLGQGERIACSDPVLVVYSPQALTHFIHVVRLIVLKGSGLVHVYMELCYLVAFAMVLNGWPYGITGKPLKYLVCIK
jgi:hypothetical protein